MRVRQNWYDGFDAKDNKVSIQWGKTMSDGSNLSVYFDRYDRERIRGIEDPKWSAGAVSYTHLTLPTIYSV